MKSNLEVSSLVHGREVAREKLRKAPNGSMRATYIENFSNGLSQERA